MLILGLIGAAVVAAVRYGSGWEDRSIRAARGSPGLDVLDERYARRGVNREEEYLSEAARCPGIGWRADINENSPGHAKHLSAPAIPKARHKNASKFCGLHPTDSIQRKISMTRSNSVGIDKNQKNIRAVGFLFLARGGRADLKASKFSSVRWSVLMSIAGRRLRGEVIWARSGA